MLSIGYIYTAAIKLLLITKYSDVFVGNFSWGCFYSNFFPHTNITLNFGYFNTYVDNIR